MSLDGGLSGLSDPYDIDELWQDEAEVGSMLRAEFRHNPRPEVMARHLAELEVEAERLRPPTREYAMTRRLVLVGCLVIAVFLAGVITATGSGPLRIDTVGEDGDDLEPDPEPVTISSTVTTTGSSVPTTSPESTGLPTTTPQASTSPTTSSSRIVTATAGATAPSTTGASANAVSPAPTASEPAETQAPAAAPTQPPSSATTAPTTTVPPSTAPPTTVPPTTVPPTTAPPVTAPPTTQPASAPPESTTTTEPPQCRNRLLIPDPNCPRSGGLLGGLLDLLF